MSRMLGRKWDVLFFTLSQQTLISQDDLGDSVPAFVFGANSPRVPVTAADLSYATCDQIIHGRGRTKGTPTDRFRQRAKNHFH